MVRDAPSAALVHVGTDVAMVYAKGTNYDREEFDK